MLASVAAMDCSRRTPQAARLACVASRSAVSCKRGNILSRLLALSIWALNSLSATCRVTVVLPGPTPFYSGLPTRTE